MSVNRSSPSDVEEQREQKSGGSTPESDKSAKRRSSCAHPHHFVKIRKMASNKKGES